jgi:hypothetical protein
MHGIGPDGACKRSDSRQLTHLSNFTVSLLADDIVRFIGKPLRGYRALTSGIPGPWSSETEQILLLGMEAPEGESND